MPERRSILAAAALVALVLLTFGRILGHGFVNWDDQGQLYENPDFNPPTVAKVATYWTGPHMNLYLPVTYTVWGGLSAVGRRETADASGALLDARLFHAANLLAHAASTVLVFAILRTLRMPRMPAAIGAAVFGVHPLMAEPVAWASALYTVLSGAFSLLAVWQYLVLATRDAAGEPVRRTWRPITLATVALVLAMLSKPSAVVVPVIVAALDLLLVRRPVRRVLVAAGFWMLLAVPIMLLANRFQPAPNAVDLPAWQRLFVATDALTFYFGKIIWPCKLAADYGRFPEHVLATRVVWFTWIVPGVLAIVALIFRRAAAVPIVALIVFVVGLGPYLGLKKFDFQYFSTVADRYCYVSMLGVALLVAWMLSRQRRVALAVAGVVVALLAARSFVQAGIWRDSETLFNETLKVNPDSVVAHNTLAYLARRGGTADVDTMVSHYQATLRVRPRDAAAHYNLANLLLSAGRFDEAVAHYRAAAEAKPTDAQVWNNLGAALAQSGRLAEAEEAFLRALAADPSYEPAATSLARVREKRAASTSPATQP